ncbi:MAG: hypothetical protein ISS26_02585 [Candidatus Omnitrophica bacterium]|nr:hypothetical protein [Candidatus Omnitrophota bacterium]
MNIIDPAKVIMIVFLCASFGAAFIPAPCAEPGSIPAVSLRNISDTDVSPKGRAALSLYEKDWKHAETDHFVYHFMDEEKAEIIYLKAEYYYKWVKIFFGVDDDNWKKKSHIFIFSSDENWNAFKDRISFISGAGAFTNGWELYIYPSPYWLAPMKTIAHEISHVIVFRFLEGPIPLFLNEGLAQYASARALAVRFKGNEYKVRKINRIARDEFIDLDEMIYMKKLPENVIAFYDESELLIRHLVLAYGREKFYELALEVSKGRDFKVACEDIYETPFKDINREFENIAISKD